MARPMCFTIMPFGTKKTGIINPHTINFDSLWERALFPAINEIGYDAVRADRDIGGMIISDMLERLYFSDLVLADLTVPNANVHYELGVRHAVKRDHCVIISAEWSKSVFDLSQIRQVRYPLPEGNVNEFTATRIKDVLVAAIPALARGTSPVFQTLTGYPTAVVPTRESVIRNELDELSTFIEKTRRIRLASQNKRSDMVGSLIDEFPPSSVYSSDIAIESAFLLRDYVGWDPLIAYCDSLPDGVKELPVIREQRALAESKRGNHVEAIAALESLIGQDGDSSERQSLIAGRYKRLLNASTSAVDKMRYLRLAIKHYERAMTIDLNDYLPAYNLALLYRQQGDENRFHDMITVARVACQKAIERNPSGEQVGRETLLEIAFVAHNIDMFEKVLHELIEEYGSPSHWFIQTMIAQYKKLLPHCEMDVNGKFFEFLNSLDLLNDDES